MIMALFSDRALVNGRRTPTGSHEGTMDNRAVAVIPTKVEIQGMPNWIPTFVGMTS
jgi:hypothetical protein